MAVVRLEEEKQRKLKTLTKIIEVIAKIGKVFCYIILGFLAVFAIAIPVIIKNVEIKDNEIFYANESIIKVEESENKLIIKMGDSIVAEETNAEAIQEIKDFLANSKDSKLLNTTYLELCLAVMVSAVVLSVFFLKHLALLARNIHDEDTPFTLDNVIHIRKMAYFMIAIIVVPAIISGIADAIVKTKAHFDFNFFNITEILCAFAVAHIFEYGYKLQQDSKGKIYGNEKD